MKKLIAAAIITGSLVGVTLPVTAASNSPLKPSYKAVYCYPGGTYWQNQISRFPAYYATNNATFTAKYGATTRYC